MPDRKDDSAKPGVLPLPASGVHPTLFRFQERRGSGFAVIAPPVMEDAHHTGETILHFIHESVMLYAVAVNTAEKKRQSKRVQMEAADAPARNL